MRLRAYLRHDVYLTLCRASVAPRARRDLPKFREKPETPILAETREKAFYDRRRCNFKGARDSRMMREKGNFGGIHLQSHLSRKFTFKCQ